MSIRLLIVLLVTGLLINADAIANDALSFVRIVEGIAQQRPPNTRQTIGRRYVWNFKGKPYTVLMTIDLEKYNSYSGKERYDIPKLVEEGRTTIGNLTREFQRIFKQNRNWKRQDHVDFVLSFVQSLPYTLDDVTTGYDEFRRYAVETLIEGGGDCEDTTILVGAILRGLGEETALIFTPGHIAIGVSGDFTGSSLTYNGIKYFYCETTGTGWTVGALPASVGKTVEAIVPLSPSKVGPAPKPDKVTTPTPETEPTPVIPEPTLETPPIQPKPEPVKPKPEPEKPKPNKKDASKTNSAVGMVIATLFILIGLGIPIAYVVYRFVFADDDDDWHDDNTQYDDTQESKSPLDW
ncbi:MAG: hypothetical protein OXH00_18455 [Candidatus Poribacteria bacterium]|nr:hypothetical protein [Candidatus Poribacteria bacterium]